ncbi:sensor histidine kinase [Nucisporomicrobium flavum]|uniref:sensor histidine kinase n=1 Tax=Nucisporomicrobium flavum TaxID=2785915 RepID=UPI003C2D0142
MILDSVWAATLLLFVAYATSDPPGPPFPGPAWAVWPAAVLVAVPLIARRRWPLAVLAWVAAAGAGAMALGVAGAGVLAATFAPAALALGTVGSRERPSRSVPALAVTLLVVAGAVSFFYAVRLPRLPPVAMAEASLWFPGELAAALVVLVACWATGVLVRWRRGIAAELAHAAVLDERLRIARELHDIIGHSMSLISVKATVANHLAGTRPEEAREALTVIERTSRTAMADIRRSLGALRTPGDAAAELTPAPGLADVPRLVEAARSAGVEVGLRVHGVGELPPALGLTVHRIVQEALTNVLRHSGATHGQVVVEAVDGELRVAVTDDGRGDTLSGGGLGLAGIRERVQLYGGSTAAGPRPGGGFAVEARLPYP